MFHTTFTRTAKTVALSASLLLLPAAVASAQTPYYGVTANVQTSGMPGSFSNYSGALSLDNYEYRESDPPGGYTGYALTPVWADGGARGWAQPGELRISTDATANHLNATALPTSSAYGFGEVRFWDSAVVTSSTLPVGTPVTLVFRSELQVDINGRGNFSGVFYGTHTIAGRSVSLQQSFGHTDMDFTTSLPLITVSTKVGSRFNLSGRATLSTHAQYYTSTAAAGVVWDGSVTGNLVLKPVLESASEDVYLVTDAGVVYTPAGI